MESTTDDSSIRDRISAALFASNNISNGSTIAFMDDGEDVVCHPVPALVPGELPSSNNPRGASKANNGVCRLIPSTKGDLQVVDYNPPVASSKQRAQWHAAMGRPTATNKRSQAPKVAMPKLALNVATPKVPSLVQTEPPLFGTPNATRLVPNERDSLAAMPLDQPASSSSNATLHASLAKGSSRVFGIWFHYVLAHMMASRLGTIQPSLQPQASLDFV